MFFADALVELNSVFAKTKVRWGVWAGLAAFAYGSDRKQSDIDVFFLKQDTEKVDSILTKLNAQLLHQKDSPMFHSIASEFTLKGKTIDICCETNIKAGGKTYPFHSDKEMFDRVQFKEIEGVKIPLLSPEDVLVFKAICQRGKEQGKFDIFDTRNILEKQELDFRYLERRAQKCKAKERVISLIGSLKSQPNHY